MILFDVFQVYSFSTIVPAKEASTSDFFCFWYKLFIPKDQNAQKNFDIPALSPNSSILLLPQYWSSTIVVVLKSWRGEGRTEM